MAKERRRLTSEDVAVSIRELVELEAQKDNEPGGTSRSRDLTDEIARRTHRLWMDTERSVLALPENSPERTLLQARLEQVRALHQQLTDARYASALSVNASDATARKAHKVLADSQRRLRE